MKKQQKKYTAKQIEESIKYWKGVLKKMNENLRGETARITFSEEKEDFSTMFALQDDLEIHEDGLTGSVFGQKNIVEDVLRENGIDAKVVWMEGPSHYDYEWDVGILVANRDPKEIRRAEEVLNSLQ